MKSRVKTKQHSSCLCIQT